MLALHERHRGDGSWRDPRSLEIAPSLWAGVGLVRGGAGTALVGSHREVADRIAEYAALGIDEFVLSGYPHLEELYWFGEGVLPQRTHAGLFTTMTSPATDPSHPDASHPVTAFGSAAAGTAIPARSAVPEPIIPFLPPTR